MVKNFKLGTHFMCKDKKYIVVGEDCTRNEIECQTIPSDNNFYWFKVIGKNKIQLI